jgi:hypothetical protein
LGRKEAVTVVAAQPPDDRSFGIGFVRATSR